MMFLQSLQSEWLKTKRSAASWLCLAGGFFLPILYLIGTLKNHQTLDDPSIEMNGWILYSMRLWQFMGILLLPVGIVLAASLLAQTEYKNNTWKQLHTTPQSYSVIFSAKFITILLMTLKFFVFFNIGMLITGIIPSLVFNGRLPQDPLPVVYLLKINAKMFISCLPVIALQYIFSTLSKNFLVPVGIGLLAVIATLILLEGWEYAWLIPYSYGPILSMNKEEMMAAVNIYWLAIGYFATFMLLAYLLYRTKKAKG
jgi:hypothetical protein